MAKKLLCLCMTLLVMLGVTACSSSQKTADLPKVMEDMKAIMENKDMMKCIPKSRHIGNKVC